MRSGNWLAAAALWLACVNCAGAIEIDRVLWGFDGQATKNSFNPLSVLVSNPTGQTFNGTLELQQSLGAGRVVAALREDVYLAPSTSRWVQFYPFIKDRWDDWTLQWGRRSGERFDVPRPRLGEQNPVELSDPDNLVDLGGEIKRFPENLFPPAATATDTLRAVVLDHVPRWEEVRRESFHDWLARGGHVHLLKGVNGEYPKFTGGLSELNSPSEHFRVGAGFVSRHDLPRSRIERNFIEKTILPELAITPRTKNLRSNGGRAKVRVNVNPDDDDDDSAGALFEDFSGGIFAFLKTLVIPNHNWPLIYTMAVMYTLTIGPGLYLLGRRRLDYRLIYAALLGVVVVFSLGFAQIGRRGHGEATSVNSLAIARQLPDGALDITSWSNIFVIDGGIYEISHAGTGSLYATAQSSEAVNGVIRNGTRGRFDVEIPLYGSRPFIHRMRMKEKPFIEKVSTFDGGRTLTKLLLAPSTSFPQSASAHPLYAIYRDRVYRMTLTNNALEADPGTGQPVATFFSSINSAEFSRFASTFGNPMMREAVRKDPKMFDRFIPPLMALSLGLQHHDELAKFAITDDRVRLFVPAALPQSFAVQSQQLTSQKGLVLYVVDVLKPVTK